VVTAFLEREAEAAQRSRDRLVDLATAIPFLAGSAARPGPGEVEELSQLDGEVTRGGDPLFLLTKMIQESRGDMLWLRPDAWRMPRESAVSQAVGAAIATGRRSRAIYPVRALHEASDALLTRARMGEQIRVISELPTRMIVLGTTHAVIPEPLGMADEPRLLVRQRGVVEALTMLFELLWERAAPVPELDLGEARPDLRRFLLQQLAAGAKDEQIARTLGISLRTVRRRVADLLIELGVDTRFQAGAEAVRRGWL
jgi:DNA-binding CsgD family transcriptional regulator